MSLGSSLNEIWIKIKVNIDDLGRGLGDAGKSLESFGNKATALGTGMGKVFDPLMSGLVTGIGAVTTAIGGFAGAALNIGGDFEHTMIAVQGVAGASTEEFEKMSDAARQIGRDLPLSAADAASAMYSLASAGLSTEQILASVKDVAQLSVAQNYDLGESANLLVGALQAYGMEASEAGRVTDIFSNAAAGSMMNMDKFSNALVYVGTTASSLGLDLEQTSAAMMALSNANLAGSQIGTGLRSVLASLVNPSKTLSMAFDKMKYSAVDSNGQLKPLDETFRKLRESGMTAADAAKYFGIEGSNVALILAQNADNLKEFEKSLGNVGRTQSLVTEQMKSWNNVMASFKSMAGDVYITAFEGIKTTAKDLVANFTEVLGVFNEWAKSTDVMGKSLNSFTKGLGLSAISTKDFGDTLGKIEVDEYVKRFENLGEGISKVWSALTNLADKLPWGLLIDNLEAIGTAIISFWAAGKVVLVIGNISLFTSSLISLWKTALIPMATWMVTNPIVAGLLAIGAVLAYATKKSYETEKSIREMTQTADEMEETAANYAAALGGNIDLLDKLPPKYRAMAEETLKQRGLLEDNTEAIKAATEEVKTGLEVSANQITSFMGVYGERMKALASGAKAAGKDIRSSVIEGMKDLPAEMTGVMEKALDQMLKEVDQGGKDMKKSLSQYALDEEVKFMLDSMSQYVDAALAKTEGRAKNFRRDNLWQEGMKDIINAAENTADYLVDTFDDPALREQFIKGLKDMGKEGGNGFYRNIAIALENTEADTSFLVQNMERMVRSAKARSDKIKLFEGMNPTEIRKTFIAMEKEVSESYRKIAESTTVAEKAAIQAQKEMEKVNSMTVQQAEQTGISLEAVAGFYGTKINSLLEAAAKSGEVNRDKILNSLGGVPPEIAFLVAQAVDDAIAAMDKGTQKAKQLAEDTALQEAIGDQLIQFTTYAEQMALSTAQSIDQTGKDATSAWTETGRTIVQEAENVARQTANAMDDPAAREKFIAAMREMGKNGGYEMYKHIATALENMDSDMDAVNKAADRIAMESKKRYADAEARSKEAGKNISVDVIQVVDKTLSEMSRVGEGVSGSFDKVSDDIAAVGKATTEEIEKAGRAIEETAKTSGDQWEKGITAPIKETEDAAKAAGAGIKLTSQDIVDAASASGDVWKEKVTTPVQDTAKGVEDISKGLEETGKQFEEVSKVSGEHWRANVIAPINETAGAIETVMEKVAKITAGIAQESKTILQAQQKLVADLYQVMEESTQKVYAVSQQILQKLTSDWSSQGTVAGDNLMESIARAINRASGGLERASRSSGQRMGIAMGAAMEQAMNQSLRKIEQAVSKLEARIRKAQAAAASASKSSGSGGINTASLASAYDRIG